MFVSKYSFSFLWPSSSIENHLEIPSGPTLSLLLLLTYRVCNVSGRAHPIFYPYKVPYPIILHYMDVLMVFIYLSYNLPGVFSMIILLK